MNPRTSKVVRIVLQVVVMVAIFAALLWYVGIGSLYDALINIKIESSSGFDSHETDKIKKHFFSISIVIK